MHGHDGHNETTTVTTKILRVRGELCESVVGFVTMVNSVGAGSECALDWSVREL